MRKLRVGVWLNEELNPQTGGGFSYYRHLLSEIQQFAFKNADIIYLSNNRKAKQSDSVYFIKWKPNIWLSAIVKVTDVLKNFAFLRKICLYAENLKKQHNQKLKSELDRRIDVIYYLSPICSYPDYPYIYTLWDIGHLSSYAFPEVSMNQNFEFRRINDDYFTYKALMVFTESNSGKQDAIKYLNINENRIKVVPIFPSEIISQEIAIVKPKNVDTDLFFIHYPAQYWAHKNHFNLLRAFPELLNEHPNLKLILTGSDHGNKKYVAQIIQDLKLTDAIIDLGFVTIEELKWLYLNSKGLVMPTFMGPTNMPLLEAAELGCPVACSNLPGHTEQLGNYGYYFDPKSPKDIAMQINQMILNNQKGFVNSYISEFNIQNTLIAIDNAFAEISTIRFCWGTNEEILTA